MHLQDLAVHAQQAAAWIPRQELKPGADKHQRVACLQWVADTQGVQVVFCEDCLRLILRSTKPEGVQLGLCRRAALREFSARDTS